MLTNPALAQESTDAADIAQKAMQLHVDGDYAAAAAAFVRAYELGHDQAATAYNAACGYSLLKDVDRGIEWLSKAIEAGSDAIGLVTTDTDLENLRSDPRFGKLVETVRAKIAAATPSSRPPEYETPRGDAVAADLRWPSLRGLNAAGSRSSGSRSFVDTW